MDDDPLSLTEVAVTAAVNRKFLVMLASLLVGAGVLTLDGLQDCLMEAAEEERDPSLPDLEFGKLMAADLTELAKLLDPSVVPARPSPDPVPSRRRRKRG